MSLYFQVFLSFNFFQERMYHLDLQYHFIQIIVLLQVSLDQIRLGYNLWLQSSHACKIKSYNLK